MAVSPASLHLLIPFAGRASPACRAALAGLHLPNLDALLTRLVSLHDDAQADTSLSPPHERALAHAFGLSAADGCIPWAAREAQQTGLSRAGSDEPWGMLTLCHWEVAIDEVVLDHPCDMAIDEAESQALLEAARPFFQEDGIVLRRSASPGRWLARGEVFRALPTASVDRAAGRPISEWAPLSDALKPVRKLQNEMQMLLYTQRVNDERIARGVPPINSFWLSGTGVLAAVKPSADFPETVDTLRAPALHDDGAAWSAAWQALDAGPVAELLAACRQGADVRLTLCGDRSARSFGVRPRGALGWVKGLFGRARSTAVLASL
jgi:hypothetical protein